jgi:flagellar assembly protein FliH
MPEDSEFQSFDLKDFSHLSEQPEEERPEVNPGVDVEGFSPIDLSGRRLTEAELEPQEDSLSEEEKVAFAQNFHNDRFIREDSLLTSAEAYASTVREGADMYRQQLLSGAETERNEARRLRQEADQIRIQAEEQRARMIEEAEQSVNSIRESARQQGYEEGYESGLQQRYEEAAPVAQRSEEVLQQLMGLRQLVRFQSEQELVQLAVVIARKLVIKELSVNSQVIQNIVQAGLKEIEGKGKITAILHPEDYEFLANSGVNFDPYLGEEQSLSIRSSMDVEPGSISIESDEDAVNFSFQQKFEELEELLSQKLVGRYARMNEIDMDSEEFQVPAIEKMS